MRKVLERAGHRVETAATAAQALAVGADREKPLDLIVTDAVMPEVSGSELAEAATRLSTSRGHLHVRLRRRGEAATRASRGLLEKPFSPQVLIRTAAAAPEPARDVAA